MEDIEFNKLLENVLLTHIPDCASLKQVERLSGGASQETYRLTIAGSDGAERLLAMRRAPGGGLDIEPHEVVPGHPGLAGEALLMRSARDAGVPEPEVYYVLEEADGLGEGFVMEWLEGIALGAKVVRSPELDDIRPKLAYMCGEVLAKIHAVDLQATKLDQILDVISPEAYIEQTWQRYRDFDTAAPMIDYAGQWLLNNIPEGFKPALVHNDFRNGNIMFSPEGIVAVLDWEVAHIGDPMRDLGWICTNSWRFGRSDLPVGGFGSYEDLFAGYESISGEPVDKERVKFWEVFGSFWWAIGCLGMAEHYRTGPDKTVERPAIGRRSSECQVDCVNLLIPGAVDVVTPDEKQDQDMPRIEELVASVRDFLHNDVMEGTSGRTNFMARVAGNSLDIVARDLQLGEKTRALELSRLQALFGDVDLQTGRWQLVHGLRDGSIALDNLEVQAHLRQTVVNQIAIDQPRYSGYKTAISAS